MKEVKTCDLLPGMKLSQDVVVNSKRLFLKGYEIKSEYIDKMSRFGVESVLVDEPQDKTKRTTRKYNEIKRRFHTETKVGLHDSIDKIVQKILKDELIFAHLLNILEADDHSFQHSVDVCIFSLQIGLDIGLSNNDLVELGVCALLHDVGKCSIPNALLKKPGIYSTDEFEMMKTHTKNGYDIIKVSPSLREKIALVALQHHERIDGSGYPQGLTDSEIDIFSKIVAIADVYHGITEKKQYKESQPAYIALGFINEQAGVLFGKNLVDVFSTALNRLGLVSQPQSVAV